MGWGLGGCALRVRKAGKGRAGLGPGEGWATAGWEAWCGGGRHVALRGV